MKGRLWQSLARKYLLAELPPGYEVKGGLIFHTPVCELLRAYCVDSSAFSACDFTICAFVQPLYIPFEGVFLNFGGRLGTLEGKANKWWTWSEEAGPRVMADVLKHMKREGEPFLDRAQDARSFAEHIGHFDADPKGPAGSEAEAYSWIWCGEFQKGRKALARVLAFYERRKPQIPWQQEEYERNLRVNRMLSEDPSAAKGLLESWADATLAAIGLAKWKDPAAW